MNRPNVNDSASEWEDYTDALLAGDSNFSAFVLAKQPDLETKAHRIEAVRAWEEGWEVSDGPVTARPSDPAGEGQGGSGGEVTSVGSSLALMRVALLDAGFPVYGRGRDLITDDDTGDFATIRTRNTIRRWQRANGHEVTGEVEDALAIFEIE